jgi:hypothetical protein
VDERCMCSTPPFIEPKRIMAFNVLNSVRIVQNARIPKVQFIKTFWSGYVSLGIKAFYYYFFTN